VKKKKKKKKKKERKKKKKQFPSLFKLALVIKNDSYGSRTIIYLVDKMPQHGLPRTLWSL
jgi:hypothetical protein